MYKILAPTASIKGAMASTLWKEQLIEINYVLSISRSFLCHP
jgi:hypothetical protein